MLPIKKEMIGQPAPSTPPRQAAAGTPPRRNLRPLEKIFSDPKEPDAKRPRRGSLGPQLSDPKQPDFRRQQQRSAAAAAVDAAKEAEFSAELDRHGIPAAGRDRLLPLLRQWGSPRIAQILGLWTFLGDGAARSPAASCTQVWGPAGSGKTAITSSFLTELGIRHLWLDCACFVSLGELQARLAEELRRHVVAAAAEVKVATPKELQQRVPPGRQLRALDRLEAVIRPSLEHLTRLVLAPGGGGAQKGRITVVLDHAQELPRINAGALDALLSLPEVLQCGSQLGLVFVSRLPLSNLGVLSAREPPSVAFSPYTASETEALLFRALSQTAMDDGPGGDAMVIPSETEVRTLCGSGLMKFAAPFLGHNLHDLLRIGEEVLRKPTSIGASLATLQKDVEQLVQQRLGLPDLSGLLEKPEQLDNATAASTAAMRNMTKAEKRLVLAAYLASRISKDDDMQFFMPEGRRRQRRRTGGGSKKNRSAVDDVPAFLRPPRAVPLPRLLAIYHRLARQPQLLGPPLLEQLMNLREAGLLRFAGDRVATLDRDPKIVCRVELPLARACAAELNVDLAEYLCSV